MDLMKINGKIWIWLYVAIFTKIVDKLVIWNNKSLYNNSAPIIDLPSHNIQKNKMIWNNYDWSSGGEEWTVDVKKFREMDPMEWKKGLINDIMLKYINRNSNILEIGIGAGRWTKILQPLAKKLILVDISEKCLEICKNIFKGKNNIEYYLINGKLDMIKDNSIDYIWSYDVFVHINPTDIEKYIKDISRILKPEGYAIIHHSGKYSKLKTREKSFRSYMDAHTFEEFIKKYKMEMVEQNFSLTHLPGDIISVFTKSSSKTKCI